MDAPSNEHEKSGSVARTREDAVEDAGGEDAA